MLGYRQLSHDFGFTFTTNRNRVSLRPPPPRAWGPRRTTARCATAATREGRRRPRPPRSCAWSARRSACAGGSPTRSAPSLSDRPLNTARRAGVLRGGAAQVCIELPVFTAHVPHQQLNLAVRAQGAACLLVGVIVLGMAAATYVLGRDIQPPVRAMRHSLWLGPLLSLAVCLLLALHWDATVGTYPAVVMLGAGVNATQLVISCRSLNTAALCAVLREGAARSRSPGAPSRTLRSTPTSRRTTRRR